LREVGIGDILLEIHDKILKKYGHCETCKWKTRLRSTSSDFIMHMTTGAWIYGDVAWLQTGGRDVVC